MKIFDTANLDEKLMKTLSADDASWIYNGLDCCVTAEVYNALEKQLAEDQTDRDWETKASMSLRLP